MKHLNGNLLAAVDVETTGSDPFKYEVIQIAVVPQDREIEPFISLIQPENPEVFDPYAMRSHGLRIDELVAHGVPRMQVCDDLLDWFGNIGLPHRRRIIPVSHNWAFESQFLSRLLGPKTKEEIFSSIARDTMLMANYIKDRAAYLGVPVPFDKVSLGELCNQFKIVNEKAHDAFYDCVAELELYECLLGFDIV